MGTAALVEHTYISQRLLIRALHTLTIEAGCSSVYLCILAVLLIDLLLVNTCVFLPIYNDLFIIPVLHFADGCLRSLALLESLLLHTALFLLLSPSDALPGAACSHLGFLQLSHGAFLKMAVLLLYHCHRLVLLKWYVAPMTESSRSISH